MTGHIITLRERKARKATERTAASERVVSALAAHARQVGGRYLVFGSAARGAMRYDSDIDILVDFSPELERDAIRMAEDLCDAERLPHDILPISSRDPDFLTRIMKDARVLA